MSEKKGIQTVHYKEPKKFQKELLDLPELRTKENTPISMDWKYREIFEDFEKQFREEPMVHTNLSSIKETQNVVFGGDNLFWMRELKMNGFKYKMIYMDPLQDHENVYGSSIITFSTITLTDKPFTKIPARDRASLELHNEAFLSYFYQRLPIAYSLLKDDGVLLISLYDNHYHHVKNLVEELLPETNVSTLIWRWFDTPIGTPEPLLYKQNHQYVLAVSKKDFKFKGKEKDLSKFKKDSKGYYRIQYPQRFNKNYPIVRILNPLTGELISFPSAYSKQKLIQMYKEGKLIFKEEGYPQIKDYIKDYTNDNDQLLSYVDDVFETDKDAFEFVGKERMVMDVKPRRFMEFLINQTTEEGDLILDTNGGIGTTGIMADDMNRPFHIIELDEFYKTRKTKLKKTLGKVFGTFDVRLSTLMRKNLHYYRIPHYYYSQDRARDSVITHRPHEMWVQKELQELEQMKKEWKEKKKAEKIMKGKK